jgi:hypothetical protein
MIELLGYKDKDATYVSREFAYIIRDLIHTYGSLCLATPFGLTGFSYPVQHAGRERNTVERCDLGF